MIHRSYIHGTAVVLACVLAASVMAGEAKTGRVRIEAKEFNAYVLLQVPSDYKAGRRWPLLVSLHGAGGSADNFIKLWASQASKGGYILLVPHGDASVPQWKETQRTWSGASPKYILWAIEEVKKTYSIDKERIYLHGFSAGGHMTFFTGLKNPDVFAAIVPVSGCLRPNAHPQEELDKAKHLPVRAVVGEKDPNHGPVLKSVEFLKGKDFKTVVLKEYPGLGHQYPREENAAILKWFTELYAEKLKAKGFVKWLEEGEKALKEGRFAEAVKALRKITDLGLHDPITDKAEALLAEADGVGAGMLLEAEEKGSAGDYRGALALLRKIVSGFPGLPCAKLAAEKKSALLLDPAVKARIAAEEEAERKEAREKEAGEALEKALRLVEDKAYGKALKALDVLAGKFGETEAGAEAARRAEALRADPTVMGAVEGKKNLAQCKRWYQLGENYRKNGAKDLALTYYEKIVKLLPDSELGRKAQRRINELKR